MKHSNFLEMAWKCILFCCFAVLASAHYSCLTWTLVERKLQLACRVPNFDLPVAFLDSFGQEQARCEFARQFPECYSSVDNGNIFANYSLHQVIFIIADTMPSLIDGQWTCTQGQNEFVTAVSTSKGILDSTDVYLTGEVLSVSPVVKVKLNCYSCREPRNNNVGFLMNKRSEDYMTYKHLSGKCFHIEGEECLPDICYCSPFGNQFTLIFDLPENHHGIRFTCRMTFNDEFKNSMFLVSKDLVFNGTDFISYDTHKTIIKYPESEVDAENINSDGNETPSENMTTVLDVDKETSNHSLIDFLVAIVSSITAILIIAMGIFVLYKYRNQEEQKTRDSSVKQGNHESANLPQISEQNGDDNGRNERSPLLRNAEEGIKLGRNERSPLLRNAEEGIKLGHIAELDTNLIQRTKAKYCEPCKRKVENVAAKYRCTECNELFCSVCKNYHKRMKSSMNHHIVEIRIGKDLLDVCSPERGNSAPAALERKSVYLCTN